mmetsp:Transcript_86164/g.242685  ORF Transcript_86164/g.242685 Transcript_86164/m.242685 type:complete len:368 (+) Transcript_86164:1-1104(+)
MNIIICERPTKSGITVFAIPHILGAIGRSSTLLHGEHYLANLRVHKLHPHLHILADLALVEGAGDIAVADACKVHETRGRGAAGRPGLDKETKVRHLLNHGVDKLVGANIDEGREFLVWLWTCAATLEHRHRKFPVGGDLRDPEFEGVTDLHRHPRTLQPDLVGLQRGTFVAIVPRQIKGAVLVHLVHSCRIPLVFFFVQGLHTVALVERWGTLGPVDLLHPGDMQQAIPHSTHIHEGSEVANTSYHALRFLANLELAKLDFRCDFHHDLRFASVLLAVLVPDQEEGAILVDFLDDSCIHLPLLLVQRLDRLARQKRTISVDLRDLLANIPGRQILLSVILHPRNLERSVAQVLEDLCGVPLVVIFG